MMFRRLEGGWAFRGGAHLSGDYAPKGEGGSQGGGGCARECDAFRPLGLNNIHNKAITAAIVFSPSRAPASVANRPRRASSKGGTSGPTSSIWMRCLGATQ
eukprot:9109202-Pyramimonas_sp.AAC.1